MSTTIDNTDSAIQDSHPIDSKIVEEVAAEFNTRARVLHKVLAAMEAVWDPYRDDLDDVLWAFHMGDQYKIWAVENVGNDVVAIGGGELRPEHLLQRIHLQPIIGRRNITPVGVGLAVKRAHKQEAERRGLSADYPVVVKR